MRRRLGGLPASLLGVRRVPPQDIGGAPRAIFETRLREHEAERHQRIVDRLPSQGEAFPSRNPEGWRAEDFLGGRGDGFMPLADAAEVLGLTDVETLDACRRGLLEADERGSFLYVRPAIVSVLSVAS